MKKKKFFYCKDKYGLVHLPLPKTDAELEVISFAYFKKTLHLSELRLGFYRVKEPYNSYHNENWEYSETNIEGYDHSRAFWNWVCGVLTCGGIGGVSYGSFSERGHKHKLRLKKWINNRQDGTNYLRKPFKRLAERVGFQREQNDSR